MNAGSSSSPLISVLMPTFNCCAFLTESISSILAQTLADFELIIINDGSTDASAAILDDFARADHRIRVLQRKNGGAGAALNDGLDIARGKYLARMDADDRTPPERFAEQVDFLDQHAEITVVGGWHRTFGAVTSRVHEFPTDPNHLAAALLFRNPISHPTVMMRRQAFEANHWRYSTRRHFPEDYDLWITIAQRHALANMPKVYLDYRILPGAIPSTGKRHWPEEVIAIQCRLLARLGLDPTEQERDLHTALAFDEIRGNIEFISDAHAWLLKILQANRQTHALDEAGLIRVLTGRYVALVRAAAANGLDIPGLAESPFRQFVTIRLPLDELGPQAGRLN